MKGQRFRSTVAPASALTSAPAPALALQESLGRTGKTCTSAGAAGVAKRVAGTA